MDPRGAQTAAFQRLRRLLSKSEIAVQTGFDRCRALDDCRRLPLSDAGTLAPLLDRVFEQGAAAGQVFGRTKLVAIARTSGTLGEPKNIPINRAYLASLDRTLLSMVAAQLHGAGDWEHLWSGRHIMLGSRPRCGTSPAGLPVCDISGLAATRTRWPLRWLNLPRHRDLWIEDWPSKAEAILAQAQGKRVVSISGLPALAADLARRACAKDGVRYLDEVWPELKLYVYGGVHLSQEQKAQLRAAWLSPGRKLRIYETYFATEAPLAFSVDANEEGLALNTLENLYLFRDAQSGDSHFASELQEGRSYFLQVTTPGGLINYAMGDRIEVVSTRPLLIRVAGREADELSMTGEKITLSQLDLALDAVGLSPALLGPHPPVVWIEQKDLPRLVWGLPQIAAPDPRWGALLDEALCRVNVLYAEALRHERVIAGSRVVFVPEATFERYRNSRLGVAQFKPKRLFQSEAEFSAAFGWSENRS